MSSVPSFTLRNGVVMPGVGLGCYAGATEEERNLGIKWMATAMHAGYKHFDTAAAYNTEAVLAKAIKEAGVKREDLFITTKMFWNQTNDVQGAFGKGLKELGTDYVDLYLIHWPFTMATDEKGDLILTPQGDNTPIDKPSFNDVWAEFEKIYESGRAKAIGASNFSIKTLEALLKTAKIVPHVNQVESHPYLAQPELKAYCDKHGILMSAYTPTGYDIVRSDPTIFALAAMYRVSPAQIILAWHIKRGVVPTPKSTSSVRQKENITLPTLADEDFETINALDRGERVCNKADERGLIYGTTYEQLGW